MEPALIQFLIGLLGGSALGITVTRRNTIRSALPTLETLPPTAIPKSPPEPVKTSQPQPALAASILAIAQSPAQPLPFPITPASQPESRLEALVCHVCPACGLQAPEKLMTEHLLGSPFIESLPNHYPPTNTLLSKSRLMQRRPSAQLRRRLADRPSATCFRP
ncbi:MAG TPA: hypothetical protein VE955_02540 [Candidatus Dormibacteraeota bacterium]|nr:hypothetical protein [Candidatus Dormibacteraeota bacterium]